METNVGHTLKNELFYIWSDFEILYLIKIHAAFYNQISDIFYDCGVLRDQSG